MTNGLNLCTRFAYPPNSLSLCGPNKKNDLKWYSNNQKIDKGAIEIITSFSTLYPYLTFIAQANNITDPFEKKVIEAYWLGNGLLENIKIKSLARYLTDSLSLKKKVKKTKLNRLLSKLPYGGFPNHAFHVLNIYKRTGNIDDNYTLETMDACLINLGKVEKILPHGLIIKTKPLTFLKEKLVFGPAKKREIKFQGDKDLLGDKILLGDYVSYHWGYFCNRLTAVQIHNLTYFTNLALSLANII